MDYLLTHQHRYSEILNCLQGIPPNLREKYVQNVKDADITNGSFDKMVSNPDLADQKMCFMSGDDLAAFKKALVKYSDCSKLLWALKLLRLKDKYCQAVIDADITNDVYQELIENPELVHTKANIFSKNSNDLATVKNYLAETRCLDMCTILAHARPSLKTKYFQDVLKADITNDKYAQIVEKPELINEYAPFLSQEDSEAVIRTIVIYKRTRDPVLPRLKTSSDEYERHIPVMDFLRLLQSLDLCTNQNADLVIDANITVDIYNAMTENPHLVHGYAECLSHDEREIVKKALILKKTSKLEKECKEFLSLLHEINLKETYYKDVLEQAETVNRIECSKYMELYQNPALLTTIAPFIRQEHVHFFCNVLLEKKKCIDLGNEHIKRWQFAKILNILSHLGLERCDEPMIENNFTNEIFDSVLHSKDSDKEFIQALLNRKSGISMPDMMDIATALLRIRKSGFQNLLAELSKEDTDVNYFEDPTDKLGEGSFGSVKRCMLTGSTTVVALKIFRPFTSTKTLKSVTTELQILGALRHPNIVNILGYVQVFSNSVPMIVMDYMEFGNLNELLKHQEQVFQIPERLAGVANTLLKISLDICTGMEYLHRSDVVHRDLKPDNVFVDGRHNAKVGDFGISQFWLTDASQKISPHPYYSTYYESKEALNGSFSFASDVWSYGVVLYQMWVLAHNKLPYGGNEPGKTVTDVKKEIRNGGTPLNYGNLISCCPPEIEAIMREAFLEEQTRLTFSKIKEQFDDFLKIPAVNPADVSVTSRLEFDMRLVNLNVDRYTNDTDVHQLDSHQRQIHRQSAYQHLVDNFIEFEKKEYRNNQVPH